MSGAENKPLLILDRRGSGRVALLFPITPGFGRAAMKAAARTLICCAVLPIGS